MGMFVYSALLPGVLILYINWYTEVIIILMNYRALSLKPRQLLSLSPR